MSTLREAYELIKDEGHWTQGAIVRSASGKKLYDTNHPEATRWCAVGAVYRSNHGDRAAIRALESQAKAMGFSCPQALNDFADHATVLAMFEKAIVETEGGL